jgi:hypothetical protein
MVFADLNMSFESGEEREKLNENFHTDRNYLVKEFIDKILGERKRTEVIN